MNKLVGGMKAKKKTAKTVAAAPVEPSMRLHESAVMPIEEIGAFEAKTHLSEILEKVANGASFYITKRGKRVAELKPIEVKRKRPIPGLLRGKIWMADDFDAPLEEFKEYM
ncbi:MAG: type II toxin-antitoxin system prevent-host-death family antitoxin [Chthoniobacteraceae bacterium]